MNEVEASIADKVMREDSLARTKEDVVMLGRLATSDEARATWRKLIAFDAVKPSKTGLLNVASSIAREVATANLLPSEMLTQQEIRKAAADAAYHATELIRLIEENASLSCLGDDWMMPGEALLHPIHRAAMRRILRGTLEESISNKQGKGRCFRPEIEAELDDWQNANIPEAKGLSTSGAYRLLRGEELNSLGGLVSRLVGFVELTKRSAALKPIVARPNATSAKEHALALNICHVLDFEFGSPCYEISAGFVSAVFETVVDLETVKKWRQRDNSTEK